MSSGLKTAADAQPQVLVSGFAANAETTVYTTPAATSVRIAAGSVCNVTGSAATISLSLVKTGGTAGTSNRVLSAFSLPAGDTQSLKDYLAGHVLGPGDFISVLAGTTSAIALVISGVVFN